MSEQDLIRLLERLPEPNRRASLARWIESTAMQRLIIAVILLNGLILGLETSPAMMDRAGTLLLVLDKLCLLVFIAEILIKLVAYRGLFWRNGWNWFDFLVVAIALVPNAGPWAVLRSLRILRVLRLLTVMPQLRKVIAAFIHAIPGLSGVIVVMAVFFYTMGVLATNLFGETFPAWFGTLGASLYSLFQIMTLESWSMGIVRPVMEVHPWAWSFFVPFIVIATFTILNLFIGIIVSTMQELSTLPDPEEQKSRYETVKETLSKMEQGLSDLRRQIERMD
ncbi:ion transporter [Haloferula sp. A504]|uniref:ion transporter n=1 Tax=Haloferula sp. A504 TaxID=3373601 RepID=UPI0031C21A89|nr:ion transporter [Verrucomicrobiaceae bacterium E54]